jgi:hypothetical protein
MRELLLLLLLRELLLLLLLLLLREMLLLLLLLLRVRVRRLAPVRMVGAERRVWLRAGRGALQAVQVQHVLLQM